VQYNYAIQICTALLCRVLHGKLAIKYTISGRLFRHELSVLFCWAWLIWLIDWLVELSCCCGTFRLRLGSRCFVSCSD